MVDDKNEIVKIDLEMIDSPKKLVLTPTAGKEPPYRVLAFRAAKAGVKDFFVNVNLALKAIVKGVM